MTKPLVSNYLFSILLIFAILRIPCTSNAQISYKIVDTIYTDYGPGIWKGHKNMTEAQASDSSHNLLAFKLKGEPGTVYSTGANDALLTSKGIAISQALHLVALPVGGLANPAGGTYIGLGYMNGGTAAPNPGTIPGNIATYLTDGINGLDIGTGVFNLPSGNTSSYYVESVNINNVGDGKPDLVITQIGDPSGSSDSFCFYDKNNILIGKCNQAQFGSSTNPIDPTGKSRIKFYTINTATAQANYTTAVAGYRDIRIITFDLADFNITSGNYSDVAYFKHTLSGTSDQAFVAYNPSTIKVYQKIEGYIQENLSTTTVTGAGGLTIELYDKDHHLVQTTTTNSSGYYEFINVLPSADYYVKVILPAGYAVTRDPNNGTQREVLIALGDHLLSNINFQIHNSALPVQWISFDVFSTETPNLNLLYWVTASETVNRGFDIEYSNDALQWTTVGHIVSLSETGNSTDRLAYSFTHASPQKPVHYYRLKQINLDDTYDYSIIRALRTDVQSLTVHPNPFKDRIYISLKNNDVPVKQLILTDASGKLVWSESKSENELNLKDLPFGVYFLKVIYHNGTTETARLVKH